MIKVKELMTTDLVMLYETNSIKQARSLMAAERIRHIPIVNEANQFVGLLTQRDLLATTVSALADIDAKEQEALESSIPIKEVMTTDIVAVDGETNLREAAEYLLKNKHGCLPVLSNSYLVGILTESDFVRLALNLLKRMELMEQPAIA